jgi:hypothetical protein
MVIMFAAPVLTFIERPASAHDFWKNGQPVAAWVKNTCCGPEDVHELCQVSKRGDPAPEGCNPDDRIWYEKDGFHIAGYQNGNFAFPAEYVQPSPDTAIWAFYKHRSDEEIAHMISDGCGGEGGPCFSAAEITDSMRKSYEWTPLYCLFIPFAI